MGLLVGMGLEVGEALPPQLDNPRGFFESVLIVNENRRILSSMDRDWTCPPRALDRSAIDPERLHRALDDVAPDRTRPWGFKDPRTLFTLEAWLSVLENVRILGVYRPVGSVAKSLERRDRFSQAAAHAIALLYNDRLAQLHQELGFPVVQFGGDRDALLEHMASLSRQLDLDWDPEFAKDFFETELIHHPSPDDLVAADEYLESVVDMDVRLATLSGNDAVSALRRVESHSRYSPVSPYLGPQFLVRRTRLWSMLRRLGGEVGSVLELVPDDGRQFNALEGTTTELYQRRSLADVEVPESAGTYTHVLATDGLDLVSPDDLDEFLAQLLTMTDIDGVVGLSGHIADGEPIPLMSDEPARLQSAHDQGLYLHQRDDVEHAVRRFGWHISAWREDLNVVVLARSAKRSDLTVLSPSEMRARLRLVAEERAELERRLDEAGTKVDSLSRKLVAAQRDYTRLRSRRIVRVSLAMARPLKPLFAWSRVGGGTPAAMPDNRQEPQRRPRPDDPEVAYFHIRWAADNGDSTPRVAPGVSTVTPSSDRSETTGVGPLRLGLFVPASKGSFPASTHVRVLRRFYHSSMEKYVSPLVFNAERYVAADSPPQLDVALVQRTGVSPTLTDEFLQMLGDRGIPLVLDLDDDIIGMPASHPDFDAFRDWRGPLERLATRADLITASTDVLRQRIEGYNSDVVTVRNALDAELWFAMSTDRDGYESPIRSDRFRLLYFGTRTHGNDLRLIEEFVRRPGNATTLTVVGGAPPGTLDWCEHIDPPRASREYPMFVQWLRRFARGFDAVVAPLADTTFNQSKSDLKFLEGTGVGLPVICSDVPAFAELRHLGVALLSGPTPDEWAESILSLRDQPDLRAALADASSVYVRSERLMDQQSDQLARLLGDLTTRANPAR
jgi:glycosyltransferase involved in cell wall biosynthesis